MKISIFLKGILISAGISGLISLPITYFSKATFFATMFLIWAALYLNGCVLTWEDAMPGGIDNEDGSVPKQLQGANKVRFWLTTLIGTGLLASIGGYFSLAGW